MADVVVHPDERVQYGRRWLKPEQAHATKRKSLGSLINNLVYGFVAVRIADNYGDEEKFQVEEGKVLNLNDEIEEMEAPITIEFRLVTADVVEGDGLDEDDEEIFEDTVHHMDLVNVPTEDLVWDEAGPTYVLIVS